MTCFAVSLNNDLIGDEDMDLNLEWMVANLHDMQKLADEAGLQLVSDAIKGAMLAVHLEQANLTPTEKRMRTRMNSLEGEKGQRD